MPELTSNVSSLVVSQLPDFIRGDYDTITSNSSPYANSSTDYKQFIKFVEAYYKFLEQENSPNEVLQNSRNYADVELTADSANVSLVESFFKTFGPDIPRSLTTDKKSFVKHFRDIYKTKGSEAAAKLFFRILYNEDIDFLYPSEYIFKSSDGVWQKDYILKVVPINNSNVFQFINTEITGTNSRAKAIVKDVVRNKLTREYVGYPNDIYDLYLEKIRGNFYRENIVSALSSNLVARTQYQLSTINIEDSAIGYTVNDSVSIDGSILRISDLDNFGRIKHVKIINSGIYFLDDTLPYASANGIYLSPGRDIDISSIQATDEISISPPSKTIEATVQVTGNVGVFLGNVVHGLHIKDSANITFFGNTSSNLNLTTEVITLSKVKDETQFEFPLVSNDTIIQGRLTYLTSANLTANLGILRITDGYYIKNKGQASDVYKIQGALSDAPDTSVLYYQPFSYVIKSPVTSNEWREFVKSAIHPAGTEVFGDLSLYSNLNISSNVTAASEITDYLGLTADNLLPDKFRADSTSYTDSRFSVTIDLKADQVVYLFRYL